MTEMHATSSGKMQLVQVVSQLIVHKHAKGNVTSMAWYGKDIPDTAGF